jgi:O-antigen/teichoic acid export membrane protein
VSQGNVERRVWSNSVTGYARSLIRLVLGVLSFRQLCTELSAEELGFYGLVWSFLGYGVLFDFGMGVAVQKQTAALTQRKDWVLLGRILSSVMVCNCICAAAIVLVGFLATEPLLRGIGVSPAHQADFRLAWRLFILGLGAMYPLQMFREVQYGLQRIASADRASTVGSVISFVWLIVALRMHWGLSVIFVGQIFCLVATGAVFTLSALRAMPEVRLGLRFASLSVLRSIASFSARAYLVVFAGIIALQTDRFMVGTILSVSVVAMYHVGAKIPELFAAFTWQLPDALAPAAATLHEQGQRSNWQKLFLRGLRVQALITTPLFFLSLVFLEGLLALFTRGQAGSEVVFLGRILLVWSYSTLLTHGVSKAVFLMSGHEARLVRLLVAEALTNIGLSCVFLYWLRSPIGAALGSLLPALVVGWVCLWPWIAREIGMSAWQLARKVAIPPMLAALPLLTFGISCRFVPALDFRTNVPMFIMDATVGVLLVIMGNWRFALTADERQMAATRIKNALRRTMGIDLHVENDPDAVVESSASVHGEQKDFP